MKKFYVTRGFRTVEVTQLDTADELRDFISKSQAARLTTVFRRGDASAKAMMPSLIVGELLEDMPCERRDVNFRQTTHRLLDYDQPCTPSVIVGQIASRLKEAGLGHLYDHMYIEESISGKVHILAPCLSSDAAADIQRYGEILGLQFDEKCTNSSRLCALTGISLGGTKIENVMGDFVCDIEVMPDPQIHNAEPCIESVAHKPQPSSTYYGLPYDAIVEALVAELGGLPQEGERNQFLYKISCELRVITDCSPEWIASLVEGYNFFGLSREESMGTIRSACRKSAPLVQGAHLRAAIGAAVLGTLAVGNSAISSTVADAGDIVVADANDTTSNPKPTSVLDFDIWGNLPPAMPKELPQFVKTLIAQVPIHLRPHVINTCEPGLSNYLCGTTFLGIDGTEQRAGEGILAVSIAPPASGKSSRRKPLEAINHRFRLQDLEARRLTDEWCDLARRTKASDLPERPKMESHLLGADCTSSALIQKLKNLPTGALLCTVDELHMLDGLKTNASDPHNAFILAAHSEPIEVERSTEAGTSGYVECRLNLSAMGTPHYANRFFRNGWHTGLITRCQMSTIIEPDIADDNFRYGTYDDKFQAKIDSAIDLLCAAQGEHLSNRKVDDHVRRLHDWATDLAHRHSCESLRVLVRRQWLLHHKRCYLYWLLANRRFTPTLEAYLEWRFVYSLWASYKTLGHIIESEMSASLKEAATASTKRGPQSWLTRLPATFTKQQLHLLRQVEVPGSSEQETARLIAQWKFRGYIAAHPEQPNTWVKVA